MQQAKKSKSDEFYTQLSDIKVFNSHTKITNYGQRNT